MKLSYFSNQTVPKSIWGGSTADPRISFAKSGVISINAAAVKNLGLSPENKISLAQDEDQPENWVLFIDEENGFSTRGKDFEKTGCLCFNHSALVKSIVESLGLELDATHKFPIAKQPTVFGKTKYYGILVTN